jgi:hypothetical protein
MLLAQMEHFFFWIIPLTSVSCFPSTYLERPAIEVRVIDSQSSQMIEGANVTYRGLRPWADSEGHQSEPSGSVYPADKGVAIIPKQTSFGVFWPMQQPIPLVYSLTAEAPGYHASTIKQKQFTHGPFRPNQGLQCVETIKLNRR